MAALLAACGSTPTEDTSAGDGDFGQADTTLEPGGTATAIGTGEQDGLSGDSMADEGMTGLETVFYFDFDQATLDADVRAELDRHAARLRNNGRMVRLEGHADERGTREYNLALGERRAKAVANYLVLQGVDRARIETVSYGEERPASLGQDEASWRMNRRVELK
jgi:peptidoglycan-associated lipoprotein